MASIVPENMSCTNNEERLIPEIPQRDDTILMSFLEDSVQLECCDDDRLNSVIQSLEAAINPGLMNDHGSNVDDGYQLQDCLFDQLMSIDEEYTYGDQDNSASQDLDFSWMDLEISSSSSSSSSPGDHGLSCWYEQVGEEDVEHNAAQYGGVIDYSEILLEEPTCSSIWQETYRL